MSNAMGDKERGGSRYYINFKQSGKARSVEVPIAEYNRICALMLLQAGDNSKTTLRERSETGWLTYFVRPSEIESVQEVFDAWMV